MIDLIYAAQATTFTGWLIHHPKTVYFSIGVLVAIFVSGFAVARGAEEFTVFAFLACFFLWPLALCGFCVYWVSLLFKQS